MLFWEGKRGCNVTREHQLPQSPANSWMIPASCSLSRTWPYGLGKQKLQKCYEEFKKNTFLALLMQRNTQISLLWEVKSTVWGPLCAQKRQFCFSQSVSLESHTSKNGDLLLLEILQHIHMYMHIYNTLLCSSLAQKC